MGILWCHRSHAWAQAFYTACCSGWCTRRYPSAGYTDRWRSAVGNRGGSHFYSVCSGHYCSQSSQYWCNCMVLVVKWQPPFRGRRKVSMVLTSYQVENGRSWSLIWQEKCWTYTYLCTWSSVPISFAMVIYIASYAYQVCYGYICSLLCIPLVSIK